MNKIKDILDEDFDGDLDAELADVDAMLTNALPVIYLGEVVDEDLKNKFETYGCTELRLILENDKYIITKLVLDITGDEMFQVDPLYLNTIDEVTNFLNTNKLYHCQINIDSLKLN